MSELKVIHINTNDILGGAARATYRLHTGLLRYGSYHSRMVVANKYSDDPNVIPVAKFNYLNKCINRLWQIKKNWEHGFYQVGNKLPFRDHRSIYPRRLLKQIADADLLHLHWVGDFVDYPTFFRALPTNLPIVWTLHDVNPFTGGCHCNLGCGKHRTECGFCPQLVSSVQNDLSAQIWKGKKQALSNILSKRLHIVTPSNWLTAEARASSLMKRFPISTISHGLDPEEFAPENKIHARSALGVPQEAVIILFIADVIDVNYKGFSILLKALHHLKDLSNLLLLSVGKIRGNKFDISIPHRHLGYIKNNNRLLSRIYSAADLFVIPSLQESFGQTALEAMACGTPVVGSDVGGIPDIVIPGRTGELVSPGEPKLLANTIAKLLENQNLRSEMSSNARQIVLNKFTIEHQSKQYHDLYHNVLYQHTASSANNLFEPLTI